MWFSETEYDEAFGVYAFQAHCSKQQCPVLPAGSTLRRHCPHAVAAAVAFVHVVAATLRLAVAAQASGTSFVMDASSAGCFISWTLRRLVSRAVNCPNQQLQSVWIGKTAMVPQAMGHGESKAIRSGRSISWWSTSLLATEKTQGVPAKELQVQRKS